MKQVKQVILYKILPVFIIITGLLIAAYPWISDYVYKDRTSEIITNYDEVVKNTSRDEINTIRKEAEKYNQNLQKEIAVLHDPFTGDILDKMSKKYSSQLSIKGTDLLGYIEIPVINVKLPIYHGTSASVLNAGIGHLEGTSLPVGGKSTHSVLTGHSGLSNKKLFTDLEYLDKEELFFIHVLGDTLCYKVTNIDVVVPEDITKLIIQQNKDLCTLVTCTPYGVNSHRLLVTGKRIKCTKDMTKERQHKYISKWKQEYLVCIIIGLLLGILIIIIGRYIVRKKDRMKKQEQIYEKDT